MKKPVPLSYIKKKAKQLKKENPSLKHYQALDLSSKSFGHSNFKNYKNDAKAFDIWLSKSLANGKDAAMKLQGKMLAKKFSQIDPVFQKFNVPVRKLINEFGTKKYLDSEVQKICENEQLLKEYLGLFILRDSLSDIDWDLVTHCPYHLPSQVTLNNLVYSYGTDFLGEPTDAEIIYIEGEYKMNCKIMFDHTPEDVAARDDDFFEDCELMGGFEITIDKDKIVHLENIDVCCEW